MELRSSRPLTSLHSTMDLKSSQSTKPSLLTSSLTGAKKRALTSEILQKNLKNQGLSGPSLTGSSFRSKIDTRPNLMTKLPSGNLTSSSTTATMNLRSSLTSARIPPNLSVSTKSKLIGKTSLITQQSQECYHHSTGSGLSKPQLHSTQVQSSLTTTKSSIPTSGRPPPEKYVQPVWLLTREMLEERDAEVLQDDDFIVPKYELRVEKDVEPFQLPVRTDTEEDVEWVDDVNDHKREFVNIVSSSLINSPDFKKKSDQTRERLVESGDTIIPTDAEFILKVALYARRQLNIRTTANFLLTYASWRQECRPFLVKYFKQCVVLPSDWIEIAEQYATFTDKHINFGSLPAALRKVLVAKFPDFDQYQLAKYNKEKSIKKRQKRQKQTEQQAQQEQEQQEQQAGRGRRGGTRGRGTRGRGARGRGAPRGGARGAPQECATAGRQFVALPDSEDEEGWESDDGKEVKPVVSEKSYTLKQLIRKLHISDPVEHVLCLLGKRYPSNSDDFYLARLPGTFDEAIAGKRMKLPTPMTWETQVSLKGNKAATWEDLINKRKLPFMAMLRNLRNMIKAGISRRHHQIIIRKLSDQNAVINSKQFPFRFFSAYEILDELQQAYEVNQQTLVSQATEKPKRQKFKKDTPWWQIKLAKKKAKPASEVPYDQPLLNQYRKALDNAVKISTTYNVSPIKGNTAILCNVGRTMAKPCNSSKSVGSKRTMLDIGLLLGLMCKYSCEHCDLVVYGDRGTSTPPYRTVTLEKGTILDNMKRLVELAEVYSLPASQESAPLPEDYLLDAIRHRKLVDNLIIVSDDSMDTNTSVQLLLSRYRQEVNPQLLFVSVSLKASAPGSNRCKFAKDNRNDVFVTGYSEQLLRFIAERGSSGQLSHIDRIDKAYNLPEIRSSAPVPQPETRLLPVVDVRPRWRTLRVFISSTFRDMHGERDLLTRFVFPELRALARKKLIHVSEVDLRWGVTNESRHESNIERCLLEVSRCDMFVGMLGWRYGTIPVPWPKHLSHPSLKWVETHQESSMTELEFHHGVLSEQRCIPKENGFLYLRDNFHDYSGDCSYTDFYELTDSTEGMMYRFRERVENHYNQSPKRYSAAWGGIIDGKPVLAGLETFGTMVLNDLWNRISQMPEPECSILTELSHQNNLHRNFMEQEAQRFVARDKLMSATMSLEGNMFAIHGTPGSGKTALMAKVVDEWTNILTTQSREHYVISHFTGHVPGSENQEGMLRRLTATLAQDFDVDHILPENYKNLVGVFHDVINTVASQRLTRGLLVIGIDGVDMLDTGGRRVLDWLPDDLPKNVRLYLTCQTDGPAYRSLVHLKHVTMTSSLPKLNTFDKAELIRAILSRYGKELDQSAFNNELKLVSSKREATLPLYLSLVCDEIRMYGVFEELGSRLKSLPQTVSALLQLILVRLEQDHGKPLVQLALSLVQHAQRGLSESDLQWLLGADSALDSNKCTLDDVIASDRKLTAAIFFPLLRSLVGFLRCLDEESSVQLTMTSEEIRAAVVKRYIRTSTSSREIHAHKLLAGLYKRQSDPDGDGSYSGLDVTALTQLTRHLILSESYDEYERVVCDLRFIKSKSDLCLTESLLDDYLQTGLPVVVSGVLEQRTRQSERLVIYKEFVTTNSHTFRKNPSHVYQTAVNAGGVLAEQAETLCGRMIRHLNRGSTNRPELVMEGFPTAVVCTAVSRDGKLLACGLADGDIQLANIETGKIIKTLSGHSNKVTGLTFAVGNNLVSSSADTNAIIWDYAEGTSRHVLKSHIRSVSDVASSHDGRYVATAGWDCCVRVWTVKDGKLDNEHIKDSCPFNCVTFHPELELVATGGWDGKVKIWSYLHSPPRRAILTGHVSSVRSLCYSENGRHLFSCSLEGAVNIWSAQDGKLISSLIGHSAPVNRLALHGRVLITCSDDWKTKLWQSSVGRAVYSSSASPSLEGATCLSLCQDGDKLVVGYHGGRCRLYSIKRGICTGELKGHGSRVTSVKLEPSPPYNVYSTGDDGQLLYSSDRVLIRQSHDHGLTSLAVSRDNKMVAVADGRLFMVTVYQKSPDSLLKKFSLSGHTSVVSGISFTVHKGQPTGLVTSSRDGMIMTWNLADGCRIREIVGHEDWINGCQVMTAPKMENQILTCSNDFNLCLWDGESGDVTRTFTGHQASVNSVAETNGCIISGSSDGCVRIWSYKGRDVTTLYGHTARVNQCDIITVKDEEEEPSLPPLQGDWATLAATDEWEELHEKSKLSRQTDHAPNLLAASCCDDGKFIVWKPLEFTALSTLCGHSDRVVSISTDKTRVFTASLDKSVRLWPLDQHEGPGKDIHQQHNGQGKDIHQQHNGPGKDIHQEHNGPGKDIYQHEGPVQSLSVSLTKLFCLSASWDGCVKLWDCTGLNEERRAPTLVLTHQAHNNYLTTAALSDDVTRLATATSDGDVVVWTLKDSRWDGTPYLEREKSCKLASPAYCMAWLEHGHTKGVLIVGTDTGLVYLVHPQDGVVASLQLHHDRPIHHLVTKPGNDDVLAISTSGHMTDVTIRVTQPAKQKKDVKSKKPGKSVPAGAPVSAVYTLTEEALSDESDTACFDAGKEGEWLGHSDGTVTFTGAADEERYQLGRHAVAGLGCHGDYIVAIDDKNIRVVEGTDTISQLGHYVAEAPLKHVRVFPPNDGGDRFGFVCGDQLGNVLFLQWNP